MAGNIRIVVCAVVSTLLAVGAAAFAQPVLVDIGAPAGGQNSFAAGISADGTVVVGSYDGGGRHAFRWSRVGGVASLGNALNHESSAAYGVSADGEAVAGSIYSNHNFGLYWTSSGGWEELASVEGSSGNQVNGISADGTIVVGTVGNLNRAFSWTRSSGLVMIERPANQASTQARAVSRDGSVIVGQCDAYASRWTPIEGWRQLDPQGSQSAAYAVSPDGTTVVGYYQPISGIGNPQHAFRWTSAAGLEDLGVAPGKLTSYAYGVSADGAIVVGQSNSTFSDRAAVWTSRRGMMLLSTYLAGVGVNLSGWVLDSATCVSADGTAIAGWGHHNGILTAWVVLDLSLVACGPADVGRAGGVEGGDGHLDNNDFIVFITRFFASDPRADFGATGGLPGPDEAFDNNDFIAFINLFFNGCTG